MSKVTQELRQCEEAVGYHEAMVKRIEFEERFRNWRPNRGHPDAYSYQAELAELKVEEELWRALLSTRIFNANFKAKFNFDAPIDVKLGEPFQSRSGGVV